MELEMELETCSNPSYMNRKIRQTLTLTFTFSSFESSLKFLSIQNVPGVLCSLSSLKLGFVAFEIYLLISYDTSYVTSCRVNAEFRLVVFVGYFHLIAILGVPIAFLIFMFLP